MKRDPAALLRWAQSRAREYREAADQSRAKLRHSSGWRETNALREEIRFASGEAATFDRLAVRYQSEINREQSHDNAVSC